MRYTSLCVVLFSLMFGVVRTCSDGWSGHGSSCYHFSHDQEDWTGAMEMCKILGGSLVEINNAAEQAYLTGQAKVTNRNYWIALTDVTEENVWVWMNSGHHLTEFTNWNPGEPNNDGDQNCVKMYTNGRWDDAHCYVADSYYFICETDNLDFEVVG